VNQSRQEKGVTDRFCDDGCECRYLYGLGFCGDGLPSGSSNRKKTVSRWPSKRDQLIGTRLSYKSARIRCRKPSANYWNRYGGRGVRFLFTSFQEFLDCVGLRPSPAHSIDRWPNPDGHYEPGNVRWATPEQQANNRRAKGERDGEGLMGPKEQSAPSSSTPLYLPPTQGGVFVVKSLT
jgi:hypothetical protein